MIIKWRLQIWWQMKVENLFTSTRKSFFIRKGHERLRLRSLNISLNCTNKKRFLSTVFALLQRLVHLYVSIFRPKVVSSFSLSQSANMCRQTRSQQLRLVLKMPTKTSPSPNFPPFYAVPVILLRKLSKIKVPPLI